MVNSINKIICQTVNEAINKKSKEFERDVTYVCRVEERIKDTNMYKLKHNNVSYIVPFVNITPKIYDIVHLILPKGNLKDKYVLEDVIGKYSTGGGSGGSSSGSGFSGNYNDLYNKPTSLPANGGNSDTVNGFTVESNVPANAKFTDTVYEHPKTGIASSEYNHVVIDQYGHIVDGENILLRDEILEDKDTFISIIENALIDIKI